MTDWVPDGVDITVPNVARMYDYALGGVHNFPIDRELWEQAERLTPEARRVARENRAFLRRAVGWLAREQRITQFLDIGSGIPTSGNVHEVAPAARVVYVDIDPVAVAQGRSLLRDVPNARAVRGDLLDPGAILADPEVTGFLDLARPVAVLTVAVLHFVPDRAGPREILARLGAALAPGSFLVLSHLGPDESPGGLERQAGVRALYERTPTPLTIRTAEQVSALLGEGFEALPPGIVTTDRWHASPAGPSPQPAVLAVVARRR